MLHPTDDSHRRLLSRPRVELRGSLHQTEHPHFGHIDQWGHRAKMWIPGYVHAAVLPGPDPDTARAGTLARAETRSRHSAIHGSRGWTKHTVMSSSVHP